MTADHAPEPAAPAAQDELRDILRVHHPIMRSETGPFSGCRCGQVRLGQDVIAHVVGELVGPLAGLLDAAAERDAAEDFRHDMAMQAYTAPDAAPDTIRQSLAARIADLVAERDALRATVASDNRQREGDDVSDDFEPAEVFAALRRVGTPDAMTAPEPVAPPAQDELREALIRAWNHSEWIVKGSGEDRRIVMADTAERFDALLAGPLAGLVAERDALRAKVARVEALCERSENSPMQSWSLDFDGNQFPATVTTADVRAALGDQS